MVNHISQRQTATVQEYERRQEKSRKAPMEEAEKKPQFDSYVSSASIQECAVMAVDYEEEIPVDSEELDIDSEELDIDSEELDVDGEELDVDGEELDVDGEELDVDGEELDVDGEELDAEEEVEDSDSSSSSSTTTSNLLRINGYRPSISEEDRLLLNYALASVQMTSYTSASSSSLFNYIGTNSIDWYTETSSSTSSSLTDLLNSLMSSTTTETEVETEVEAEVDSEDSDDDTIYSEESTEE